jgi:pimeloyl-ACP methyl ester carboxylesterase
VRHHASLRLSAPIAWSPGAGQTVPAALSARVHGSTGRPIVLLHGLGGSRSVWGSGYDSLGADHQVIAIDLLGCGRSPHPTAGYTLDDHAALVARTLAELGVDGRPAVVVGHSFGSLVALRLALRHPGQVAGIVALCPPLFRSAGDARALTVAAITPVERFLYMPTWWARLICRNVCMKRPELAQACARRLRAELPPVLVNEAIMHTWESYSQSMAELLSARARPEWLAEVNVPVHVIRGGQDAMPDVGLLEEMAAAHAHVSLTCIPDANHLVPLTHVSDCVSAIRGMSQAIELQLRIV